MRRRFSLAGRRKRLALFSVVERFRDASRTLGPFATTVGGVWVGLLSTTQYTPILSPTRDFQLAIGICGLGIAITAFGWMPLGWRSKWRQHWPRSMTVEDINELYLLLRTFGPTSPLDIKHAISRKNPKCFVALEADEPTSAVKPITGYYVTYRLTQAAVSRLRSGAIRGNELTPRDVVAPSRTPYGLYVSFLWAKDRSSKAAILRVAERDIASILARRNAIVVFARAATTDSLRLLLKYNFRPLLSSNLTIDTDAFLDLRQSDTTLGTKP